MPIMDCRLDCLQHILNGFIKTKVPLIAFDGTNIAPFAVLDDIGIYVLIPQLAHLFNLTTYQAINYFFYGITATSFIASFIGFFLLYNSYVPKVIASFWLILLGCFIIRCGLNNDVYIAYLASSIGIIPLFLYFMTKKFNSIFFYLFLILSGISLGTLSYIRAHSGLGTLIFIITMIITHQSSYKKKLLLVSSLFLGTACSTFYFQSVIKAYEVYAQENFKEFKSFPTCHPFWHPIYLGFGFLKFFNKDNISWADTCGADKVNEPIMATNFDKYESILKHETYLLWKDQKLFIFFTIFAKLGILFFYLLTFANIGLIIRLFYCNPWQLECSFLFAFMFNAIFPLISLPSFGYSLGFISMATLYGIISINALSKEHLIKFYCFFKKRITNQVT
jgi:hypothetical protein